MKNTIKNLSVVSLLLSANTYTEQNAISYYSIRSQGRNAPHNLIALTDKTHLYGTDDFYGTAYAAPGYSRSIKSHRISKCLLGDNLIDECNSTIKISGSAAPNRTEKDLLADYFYLPTDFESMVTIDPRIENFFADLGCYLGLDGWAHGLYMAFYAPLVHTGWDLNICERTINPGIKTHDAGYFATAAIPRNQLLKDFTSYAQGDIVTNIDDMVMQPLRFAKMSSKKLYRTRLAELRAQVGWDFILKERSHCGLFFELAGPTGIRPKAQFLFEAMVGNGHHWEFGGGLNAHYTFWQNDDETRSASIWFDAHVTHLFNEKQKRTFDLTDGGTLSRYMLAEKMGTPDGLLRGGGNEPTAQFKNEFAPVANITSLDVAVNIGVQADLVVMFNARSEHCSWDIGYNYWARSSENLDVRESIETNTWALKGNASVFGFTADQLQDNDMMEVLPANAPVALSATQHKATIHTGTNAAGTTTNPSIDFPQLATVVSGNQEVNLNDKVGAGAQQINTSVPQLFITNADLNIKGAQSRGASSKVFTHFNYTWTERNAEPYLGIGAEAEFGHTSNKNSNSCQVSCNTDSIKCSLSQWGIWIKGGITFE